MTPDQVTAKLAAIYPFFFNDENKAGERMELYRNALSGLAGDRLEAAYKSTMASWKDSKNPPMPAHIAEHAPKSAAVNHVDTGNRSSLETDRLMAALLVTPLGREIAKEGLCFGLHSLIERRVVNGASDLTPGLVAKLKATEVKFQESVAKTEADQSDIGKTLQKMGETMRAKKRRANERWIPWLEKQEKAA